MQVAINHPKKFLFFEKINENNKRSITNKSLSQEAANCRTGGERLKSKVKINALFEWQPIIMVKM